jgi:hypothetical protein
MGRRRQEERARRPAKAIAVFMTFGGKAETYFGMNEWVKEWMNEWVKEWMNVSILASHVR